MKRGPKTAASKAVIGAPIYEPPKKIDFDRSEEMKRFAIDSGQLFGDASIKVWDRIAPMLSAQGRLEPLFLDSIIQFCMVQARLTRFTKQLDEEGWTYESGNEEKGYMIKNHPLVGQVNMDSLKLRQYFSDLGLSPAALSSMPKEVKEAKADNLDDLMAMPKMTIKKTK